MNKQPDAIGMVLQGESLSGFQGLTKNNDVNMIMALAKSTDGIAVIGFSSDKPDGGAVGTVVNDKQLLKVSIKMVFDRFTDDGIETSAWSVGMDDKKLQKRAEKYLNKLQAAR